MGVISEFRAMPEARSGAMAPIKQIGLGRSIRIIAKALVRSRLNTAELPRQGMLALWDTLGTQEAIIDPNGERISFAEYKTRVLKLASALSTLGLKQGDACAELLYNGSTWFELNGACTLMGIQMPMLNWHLRSSELRDCINAAQPKALIFDLEFLDRIEPILNEIPSVEHVILVGGDNQKGFHSYESITAQAQPNLPPGKLDMAARPYSGGTTGTPKYMNINRERLTSDNDADRRGASKADVGHFAVMQLTAFHHYKLGQIKDPITHNVRSLIPGPLYHAGVQVGVLPFFLGGTVVPMRKFSADGMLELIEKERINWTFVAPTMLERILKLPEEIQNKYDLSSMVSIICAAAPCPPKVKKDINALFRRQGAKNDVFHEYYAASETGLVTVLAPEDYQEKEIRYDSVGKIRGCDCRIFDPDTNQWAEVGKEGKVIMRTPTVYGLEYAGVGEDEMKKCFVEVNGELWYDDGLIGYTDEDGFLYLTSRVKEMIITGGVNLFPNEIENVIKKYHKVADVAVVRGPDKDLGEVPVAVVQLVEGQTASAEEILEHCKQEGLYGFKLPKIIDFGELPRNLAGKLPKKDIEARYWQGQASHG